MAGLEHIAAISLDLDDTLWPIAPVIEDADRQLHDWLRRNCPRAAPHWPIAAMRELRERVASENPHLAHDFSEQRRTSLRIALLPHGYDEDHVEGAFDAFFVARNRVRCYPDVVPALERLAAHYPLISLSNGNADLERIGLAPYFRGSIRAAEFGEAKPAAGIFHAACEHLGLAPHTVLHVGDDPQHDVAGAGAAGLCTAWMNRQGDGWAYSHRPDLHIKDLTELADALGLPRAGKTVSTELA